MKVDGTALKWTRCFDANAWFIGELDAQSDGISVLQQTSAGVFKLVTQGSDFSGDAAALQKMGIPADLAKLLSDPNGQDLQTGLSCPAAAAVKIDGKAAAAVRCFDGNAWLLGASSGESDGITVLQQTSAGVFKQVTQGSDFTGDAAALQKMGIPADLAKLLADPNGQDLLTGLTCPKPSAVKVDGTTLAWVGCWDGNAWIVGELNAQGDGVSVLHQTSDGVFELVTQGSDFTGSAAALQKKGIPADLAAALASGKSLRPAG